MESQGMSSLDSYIGRRIRQSRWVRGITQAELARRLSVDADQIVAYEKGTAHVPAARLFEISEALDVPIAKFFEGISMTPESGQTGSRDDLSAREAQILSDFKRMSDRQQDAILSMAQTFARRMPEGVKVVPVKARGNLN